MRTIIAIDPGTATTGFALLQKSRSEVRLLDYGCIITSPKNTLPQRLQIIARDLRRLIKRYRPQELAIETLFFAKNVKTAMAVGQARGVTLLIGAENKLKISEYTPLQVKQALTGYGRADKRQIQLLVKARLNLKNIPKPDDAADAIAIGLCHFQTVNLLK